MANLRRSARISRTAAGRRSSTRSRDAAKNGLGSVVEGEEFSSSMASTTDVDMAPAVSAEAKESQYARLARLTTPQTEPTPSEDQMNPKTVHQSTAKAPDSGLKLGFVDIAAPCVRQTTPSKSPQTAQNKSATASKFQFNFGSAPPLSAEAQKLMASVKADAVEIKAQMLVDRQREATSGTDSIKRKIATPKGKAGRFSDVHLAEFKKMDSIENHPSAFRARPGFSAPTSQSLKRKSSRADIDEPVRPRTAGKGIPGPRPVFASAQGHAGSPRKVSRKDDCSNDLPSAKRARQAKEEDVSAKREVAPKPASSTLYSPTKASLARVEGGQPSSANKVHVRSRSDSVKVAKSPATIRAVPRPSTAHVSRSEIIAKSPNKISQSQSLQFKPLPVLPVAETSQLPASKSSSNIGRPGLAGFASKFSSLTNLKSILRSGPEKAKTPKKQAQIARTQQPATTPKKVDFTPSVKSRYAVKLAAESPVPSKIRRDTPHKGVGFLHEASIVSDSSESSQTEEDDVVYPTLPVLSADGPVVHTFSAKAKAQNRRESQEFRSIFTDLRSGRTVEASKLTAINTTMNKTNPATHTDRVLQSNSFAVKGLHSPTIRQVRDSGVSNLLEPFSRENAGTSQESPGKKRRYDSIVDEEETLSSHQPLLSRQRSTLPPVPGAWTDTILEDQENQDPVDTEGRDRAAKRVRKSSINQRGVSPIKKLNAAREAAAKHAKERKGKGLLSLPRLNILSRPKSKG